MIPAVAQTLANILAGGTSLISTEQIDFNHPGLRQHRELGLNLYCYDLRATSQVQPGECCISQGKPRLATVPCSPLWFDVSFLVSAWDDTALGEQRLLSEVLMLLLHHQSLKEEVLAPALRGYGDLPITVSAICPTDTVALWSALSVPLRPALYVTVTTPFNLQSPSVQPELFLQARFTNPE